MMKLPLLVRVCGCLALAAAACGEFTRAGHVPTPAAAVSTPTSAASAPTGTVKVSTPGVTVNLSGGGVRDVSITSGRPATLPAGTYTATRVSYAKAVEKDGQKETWTFGTFREVLRATGRPCYVKVTEGEVTSLEHGPPLVANVKVGKPRYQDGGRIVTIDLELTGQAGEVYGSFRKSGQLPPCPTVTVIDGKGIEIAQGHIGFL